VTPADREQLRALTAEWHRRGMRSPAELDDIVARRVAGTPAADGEPSYGEFFIQP
jgi:hypothetical protein